MHLQQWHLMFFWWAILVFNIKKEYERKRWLELVCNHRITPLFKRCEETSYWMQVNLKKTHHFCQMLKEYKFVQIPKMEWKETAMKIWSWSIFQAETDTFKVLNIQLEKKMIMTKPLILLQTSQKWLLNTSLSWYIIFIRSSLMKVNLASWTSTWLGD